MNSLLFKPNFFTAEQIADKKKDVIEDMGEYCWEDTRFSGLLQGEFNHVSRIAKVGNFSGYICSDLPFAWELSHQLLVNNFTHQKTS